MFNQNVVVNGERPLPECLQSMNTFNDLQSFQAIDEENGLLIYQHYKKAVNWTDDLRQSIKLKLKIGNNIKRGKERGGYARKYVCSGKRKDPKGTDVGSYKNKPSTNKMEEAYCEKLISKINQIFYSKVKKCIPECERKFQESCKSMIQIEAVCDDPEAGVQFCIGLEYWSTCHYNKDLPYSILSVMCDGCDPQDIIYYFSFPDYRLKVPLRQGDILVFNPLVFHCCSNPLKSNAYIFSQYSSQKTLLCRGSNVSF